MNTTVAPSVFPEATGTDAPDDLQALWALQKRLMSARTAADVFGAAANVDATYRRLAAQCHPDRHPDHRALAQDVFVALQRWRRRALDAPATAGDAPAAARCVEVVHKGATYQTDPRCASDGEFSVVYRAGRTTPGAPGAPDGGGVPQTVAFKLARTPAENDLLLAERAVLRRLWRDGDGVDAPFRAFLPRVLDGFRFQDALGTRAANVLTWTAGAYTFAEIQQRLPQGIDPKDVAWIWRRLLGVLGATHRAGVVHGAVLPDHVAVVPQTHALALLGWTCAGPLDKAHRVPAASEQYERDGWYPREVLRREPAGPATDVAMGARCMLALLGDTAKTAPVPAPGAKALARFFTGCVLPDPRARPKDAWALLREFDGLIEQLWGKRRFHPFSVPGACPR